MSFFGGLKKFEKEAINKKFDRVRRAAILEVMTGIVLNTPVDTGRARGNWQCNANSPKESEISRKDATGNAAIREARTNVGNPEDEVFITNNLPYIGVLNNGSSKQAPKAFVQTEVMRVQGLLKRNGFS